MSPLLLALLVFVIAGGAATLWLHQHGGGAASDTASRDRDESQLAELRWRDFTRLVLQAMKGRGYEAVIDLSTAREAPARAVEIVEPGGTVVLVGIAEEPSVLDTRLVLRDQQDLLHRFQPLIAPQLPPRWP